MSKLAEMKLEKLIDQFVALDQDIKRLERLKNTIKTELKSRDLAPGTTYYGDTGAVEVNEVSRITLDPVKVKKLLGDAKFMSICHVTMDAASALLTPTQLDKCIGEITPYVKLTARKKEGIDA